jgi:hypothetical protein
MLFCSFAICNSLREISVAVLGLSGKTEHFQLNHLPKKSTLSVANKNRDVEVFEKIYHKLLQFYVSVLTDSRIKAVTKMKLKRSWAFSNLVSFCKIHLFNYINLMKFLENPEKDWIIDKAEIEQLSFF